MPMSYLNIPCFAFIFCYMRQLLQHVKSEKLREYLDFMVTTSLDFCTNKIVKKIYNTKRINKRFHSTSLTENTKKQVHKRRHDKKSRVNTDKHQNEATERRKKFLLLSLNINSRKEFYVATGIRGV